MGLSTERRMGTSNMRGHLNRRGLLSFAVGGAGKAGAVRPPWSDERHLAATCDSCADCVPACEEQLISLDDGGLPALSFNSEGCSLCGDCLSACPAGAIGSLRESQAAPFPHRLDVSTRCLSLKGIACRLCEDACEAQAIRFRLMTGGRALPMVSAEGCTGCGTCLAVCPERAFDLIPISAAPAAILEEARP